MSTATQKPQHQKPQAAPAPATAKPASAPAAEPKEKTKVTAGKAPGGITWVEWFKKGREAGKDGPTLEKEYITLREKEPAYAEDGAKLKRHAYRHRRLAFGEVDPSPKAATEE